VSLGDIVVDLQPYLKNIAEDSIPFTWEYHARYDLHRPELELARERSNYRSTPRESS